MAKIKFAVEVEFPVYSVGRPMLDDTSDHDVLKIARWDADGTLWTIQRVVYLSGHFREGEKEFEVIRSHRDVEGTFYDQDAVLGLGAHACTAAEFNDVLHEAREFLASIEGAK